MALGRVVSTFKGNLSLDFVLLQTSRNNPTSIMRVFSEKFYLNCHQMDLYCEMNQKCFSYKNVGKGRCDFRYTARKKLNLVPIILLKIQILLPVEDTNNSCRLT